MIKYTSSAEADIDEIFQFLLNEGEDYARKILGEIAGKLTLLEKNAYLGKTRDDIYLTFAVFPPKNTSSFTRQSKTESRFSVFFTVQETSKDCLTSFSAI